MKKFHTFLIIILCFIMAATITIGFFLVYPFNPLEFSKDRFPVLNENKTVHVGDKLQYQVDYCKYASRPAHVSYQLVNSVIYFSTVEKVANTPPGCGSHINEFTIPEVAGGGDYSLVTIVQYEYPMKRIITVQGATEIFKIIK